jgi:hypothetical protein
LRWSASIERALDHDPGGAGGLPDAASRAAEHGGECAHAPANHALGGPAAAPQQDDDRPPLPSPASADRVSQATAARAWIATGRIDRASIQAALVGGVAYLALACISLLLARTGETLSAIWLPNACAVAFLLRSRIGNELPFLAAAFAGSLSANVLAQLPGHVALVFALGNVVEIIAVLALTRQVAHTQPDMSRLADLARFVWAGGLVGPLLSAIITAPVMGVTLPEMRAGAIT